MGKAAMQRRIRRMRYLARLASEKPERFEMEWEKRLSSWCELIRKDAGQLRGPETAAVPRVFERLSCFNRPLVEILEEAEVHWKGGFPCEPQR